MRARKGKGGTGMVLTDASAAASHFIPVPFVPGMVSEGLDVFLCVRVCGYLQGW